MKGKMAKKGIELDFLPFLAFVTKMYYLCNQTSKDES